MATNTYQVTTTDNGKAIPLRGDMDVNIGFTPSGDFVLPFVTQDAGSFTITASLPIRSINATPANTLTVSGLIGQSFLLQYDAARAEWAMTLNNLVAKTALNGGSNDSGTGGSYVQPAYLTGGTTTQYWGKTGNGDGQVGWLTLPNSSGAGGVSFTPEVLLTQNEAGEITPDGLLGDTFRCMSTKPLIIKDPINYPLGKTISIALRHGPLGPFPVAWGTAYAFNNRQPPAMPQQAGALVEVVCRLTGDIDAGNKGGWMTRVLPDYLGAPSIVGYGVAAFIARNITTDKGYYLMRSGTAAATECAMTDMKPGETLKILRNGLGHEAFGAVEGSTNGSGNYLITGVQPNGSRAELRTGPGVRSAFDRGVLAFGGDVDVIVQDLIVSGAREDGVAQNMGNARGISLTGAANCTVKNVRIYDNQNGILTGADYTGTLRLEDCEFEANGVGHAGYTHEIYMGDHQQPWYATRTTFKNSVSAHNIKTRSGDAILAQVRTYQAKQGRELDCPNGGQIHATDCIFDHTGEVAQNDCVGIGHEGVITTRTREYIFRNCHFKNSRDATTASSFINNQDTVVVQCIDCTFEGATNWPGADANGMVGNVSVTFTGGPVGPRTATVGYQPIATTPVAG